MGMSRDIPTYYFTQRRRLLFPTHHHHTVDPFRLEMSETNSTLCPSIGPASPRTTEGPTRACSNHEENGPSRTRPISPSTHEALSPVVKGVAEAALRGLIATLGLDDGNEDQGLRQPDKNPDASSKSSRESTVVSSFESLERVLVTVEHDGAHLLSRPQDPDHCPPSSHCPSQPPT